MYCNVKCLSGDNYKDLRFLPQDVSVGINYIVCLVRLFCQSRLINTVMSKYTKQPVSDTGV